jgi:hypothetical protein
MQEHTRKRPIDKMDAARFLGPAEKITEIRRFVDSLGLVDTEDTVDCRDAFPEYCGKESQTAIKAYRAREGVTQADLLN